MLFGKSADAGHGVFPFLQYGSNMGRTECGSVCMIRGAVRGLVFTFPVLVLSAVSVSSVFGRSSKQVQWCVFKGQFAGPSP